MRIQFERTGGFTGMRLALDLTESDLPEDEWQKLQAAVQQAEFFQLPSKFTEGGQPDRFMYQVTVETETHSHTVELGDGQIPENVQPLIQRLNTLARTRR
jgi:Emfourin